MDKILVVEKGRTASASIETVFGTDLYSIITADSLEQALSLLVGHEFRLVLLDLDLPEATVMMVLGHIRSRWKSLELPILMVGTLSDEQLIERALALGADDFLSKPFSKVMFRVKVSNLLQLQETYTELIENNQQLDNILNNIPIISLVVDSDVKVQNLSHTGQEVVAKLDVLGQLGGDVFDCINALSGRGGCGKTDNCANCIVRNSVNTTAKQGVNVYKKEGVFTIVKDGQVKQLNVLVSTSPIKFKNKDSVLLSIDDVTTEKQAISEVHKLLSNEIEINKQLHAQASKLKQVTNNLNVLNRELLESRERIKQQNQQLQELNADKDKFFSIIAHDLRNPFNGILGLSNMLLNTMSRNTFEDSNRMLKQIIVSAQSAYDLLENLLDWSKTQTGRMTFKPKRFYLQELVEEVLEITSSISLSKNIDLSYELPQELEVFADRNMIDAVLRNLVINAIKFTRESGSIKISVVRSNDGVEVAVADNGVGIDGDKIHRLFKINEKTSTPGTANERGTGLGLILCKEFISKHGGQIWVESELGKGSCFRFTIPENND